MPDDYSPLAHDVEKKFQDWFGDPVSAEASLPVEVDHPIGSPVPVDLPHTADVNPIKHRTRKRQDAYPTNLLGMLFFGFIGAVFNGIGVYFLLYNLNWWDSDYWLSRSNIVLFSTLLGFGLGLLVYFLIRNEEK